MTATGPEGIMDDIYSNTFSGVSLVIYVHAILMAQ